MHHWVRIVSWVFKMVGVLLVSLETNPKKGASAELTAPLCL